MRCSGGVILMAEFKLVLGFKEGKCVQREVKDQDASIFIGKKIFSNYISFFHLMAYPDLVL